MTRLRQSLLRKRLLRTEEDDGPPGLEFFVAAEEGDGPEEFALEERPKTFVEGEEAFAAGNFYRKTEEALVVGGGAGADLEAGLQDVDGRGEDGGDEAGAGAGADVGHGGVGGAVEELAQHELELVVAAEFGGVADEAASDVRDGAFPEAGDAVESVDLGARVAKGQTTRRVLHARLENVAPVHHIDRRRARGASREHALPEGQVPRVHTFPRDGVAKRLVQHQRKPRVRHLPHQRRREALPQRAHALRLHDQPAHRELVRGLRAEERRLQPHLRDVDRQRQRLEHPAAIADAAKRCVPDVLFFSSFVPIVGVATAVRLATAVCLATTAFGLLDEFFRLIESAA
eukprot:CAMPEP_0198661478 /NCGR_PEP_ID=MMETSP1467-20131203/41992_1 /TAXON_ID=1462469 /ORGANISM="unid. sp., Strain CCMP2135" /LENGTH=343 /DNA_ID=CAMNT_0044397915 /DNA_START=339 /DNA_END=1367 /DNA_ORIENTATION=+